MESFMIGFIAGVFGVAYFVYGKKQTKFVPMLSGVLLCLYPYFFESVLWLSVVGNIALPRNGAFLIDC